MSHVFEFGNVILSPSRFKLIIAFDSHAPYPTMYGKCGDTLLYSINQK